MLFLVVRDTKNILLLVKGTKNIKDSVKTQKIMVLLRYAQNIKI